MKQILLFLFLSLVFLNSCAQENIQESSSENDNHKDIEVTVNKEKSISDLTQEDITNMRNEITLEQITNILTENSSNNNDDGATNDNLLLKEGKQFIQKVNKLNTLPLTTKYNGGVSFVEYNKMIENISKDFLRDFTLKLKIDDINTGKSISEGLVYVNNIYLGKFEEGQFSGDIKWPIGIEQFNVLVRSPNYGDGFVVLNSLNSEGKLLRADIKLKKSNIIKDLDISKNINFETDDIKFVAERCSLVDQTGRCETGKVDVKINYFNADEVNSGEASLNMNALTIEGNIVHLESGGMAFIDFMKDSEILSLKDGKTVSITYNVSQETINNMALNLTNIDRKNGYWWYDKIAGIWRETEASYSIDADEGTFTVITNNLY